VGGARGQRLLAGGVWGVFIAFHRAGIATREEKEELIRRKFLGIPDDSADPPHLPIPEPDFDPVRVEGRIRQDLADYPAGLLPIPLVTFQGDINRRAGSYGRTVPSVALLIHGGIPPVYVSDIHKGINRKKGESERSRGLRPSRPGTPELR